jgi:hypothetical protein
MDEKRNLGLNEFSSVLSLILLILIFAFPMNFLWNKALLELFCLPRSTYWQMVGLNFFVYFVSKIARA